MPNSASWLLYGANGYTGKLIAEEAARRKLRPIVAGRNEQAVAQLASKLGCEARVFELNDPHRVATHLEGITAVLNCAGPFSRTARVLIEASIHQRVHYLDITGEWEVIEHAAAQNARAVEAGISILPAVGFDVVPSDCLAAMLADRLPSATQLQLAFAGTGGFSPGTAKTILEALPRGGRARIEGVIRQVPIAWKVMEVPFRDGKKQAMTIPWGDIASAYYSTGIPNIEVYLAAPRRQIAWARRLRRVLPVARLGIVQKLAARLIDRRIRGPSERERASERSSFWGRVSDRRGRQASATLETLSGYQLTVETALASLERVLAGHTPKGFAPPSKAFGKEFILEIRDTDFQWQD